MENREYIGADYFKLRLLLNRTNIKSNQKTEVTFLLRTDAENGLSLVATLRGVHQPKTIEICKKKAADVWRSSGYTDLVYLEDFCRDFLRRNMSLLPMATELTGLVLKLEDQLGSLGIPK